jgi:hypothetical protein
LTIANQYAVKTLTLPDLKMETVCTFISASTQNEDQALDQACGSKLALLGFSSADDVRQNFNSFGMRMYTAQHSGNVPPQSPWGCDFEDLSGDLRYALFDCDEIRAHFTFVFWYRGFRVFNLLDGTQLMDLKLAQRPEFSGVLATSRGATYIVLLRDGAELEGYLVR